MNKIKWTKIHKRNTFIKLLWISMIVFSMLMSISGAMPFAYITNAGSNSVSVIDIATNKVTATVNLEPTHLPLEVAVTHSGTKVYLTNPNDNIVSVINTSTNTITANVPVGAHPKGIPVIRMKKRYIYAEQRR